MQDVIDILLGILCVAILIGGWAWQLFLYDKEEKRGNWRGDFFPLPLRIVVPLALGALITCGAAIAWVLVLFDERSDISGTHAFARIFVCLGIAIVFNIKNWLAPLFLAVSLCWTIWILGHYGEFSIIPLVTAVADWATNYAPAWVDSVYTVSVFLFASFSGITAFSSGDAPA
jgi:hypothetical protein